MSRGTWYKWKRRYDVYGRDGLKNHSRKAHNIKNVKVTEELEKLVLELRLNNSLAITYIILRINIHSTEIYSCVGELPMRYVQRGYK